MTPTEPGRSGARVVILNGPAGVGKTTTARLLASSVDNGACVHGDALRDFVVRRKDGTVKQGLGFLNGASIVTNFVDAGYDLVVFEYVFEQPGGLDVFESGYGASAPVHLFTLWADLDTVVERELHREGRERLGQRVGECYRRMERNLPSLGCLVDTSRMTPPDVAVRIEGLCDAGEGLRLRTGRRLAAAAA